MKTILPGIATLRTADRSEPPIAAPDEVKVRILGQRLWEPENE